MTQSRATGALLPDHWQVLILFFGLAMVPFGFLLTCMFSGWFALSLPLGAILMFGVIIENDTRPRRQQTEEVAT